jgi:hypothetical protein
MNGQMNVQKTPIQLPKRFLKHWLTMKNAITINTIKRQKTLQNSVTIILLFSQLKEVKTLVYVSLRNK